RENVSAPPRVIINPRNSVVYGRDTALVVAVESDAPSAKRLRAQVFAGNARLFAETLSVAAAAPLATTLLSLPVSRIGLGTLTLSIDGEDRRDSIRAIPIVVRPGDELAVAPFAETVEYLRFYLSADRLCALQDSAA